MNFTQQTMSNIIGNNVPKYLDIIRNEFRVALVLNEFDNGYMELNKIIRNLDKKKYDENRLITKDQISRITIECVHNIWYYLREVVRIPSAGSPEGVPYIANRGNIAQTWCLLHGLDSWLCLPRQQGKTKSALAAQSWAYSFGTAHATFIFINKDGDNAKTNLSDFADIIAYLPKYLRYEFIMEEDGKITKAKKSATKLEHPITHNKIIVKPKATSYEAAIGIGRGLSAPFLHFDEVEFTPYIDVIIENSVSTYETSARKSKEQGALYGRIFTLNAA